MSEPTLIQEQRAILRRLHQTTAHHTQLTTAADAQWQQVQRAYEEVRARLAEIGEEQVLRSAATRPPTTSPNMDPPTLFQSSIKNVLHSIQALQALMQTTPTSWQQSIGWAAQTPGEVVTPICSIAFSPDGRLVASGGSDKMVKIWEVHSGRVLRQLVGHAFSVDFSPDGRLLASGGQDTTVKVWEISSGHLLQTLSNPTGYLLSTTFSPDGRLLASGSIDATVKVWEVNSGRLLYTFSESKGFIESVVFCQS